MTNIVTPIAQVETAIPAFIGYTNKAVGANEKSLLNIPTRISSLQELERYFFDMPVNGFVENEMNIQVHVTRKYDNPMSRKLLAISTVASNTSPSKNNLLNSLRLFFSNGGGVCYVVSVGNTNGDVYYDELKKGLDALEHYSEPTLIVIPEGLSLDEDSYYQLMGYAIDQCAKLRDRFAIVDIHTTKPTVSETMNNFRTKFAKTDNLKYAATYYPHVKTIFSYQYMPKDVEVIIKNTFTNGNAYIISPTVKMSIFESNARNMRTDSYDNGVYISCMSAISELTPILPASPAIAGMYSSVDKQRGVWSAPSNVSLTAVTDVSCAITDAQHDLMQIDVNTGKSANSIRKVSGKGFMVWGARTLDGKNNEFRYVPSQRLFMMVEESIKLALESLALEHNNQGTWDKIRAMVDNFLFLMWRRGALVGNKQEDAFYVHCGLGQTMTQLDIIEGNIILEYGLAMMRPTEFIVNRLTQKLQTV